jgi:hypothetical protein
MVIVLGNRAKIPELSEDVDIIRGREAREGEER